MSLLLCNAPPEAWTESIHDEIIPFGKVSFEFFSSDKSIVCLWVWAAVCWWFIYFSAVLMKISIGYFCSGAVQLPYHTATVYVNAPSKETSNSLLDLSFFTVWRKYSCVFSFPVIVCVSVLSVLCDMCKCLEDDTLSTGSLLIVSAVIRGFSLSSEVLQPSNAPQVLHYEYMIPQENEAAQFNY